MKNAGLTIGMCAIGLGLASIGLNLNGNQATATPAAFHAGPGEPTIVWYDTLALQGSSSNQQTWLFRAWSDGTIEGRHAFLCSSGDCECGVFCVGDWIVISSPNEGLNASADINFDERVDAADLGQLLASWGDAPRNDYPPSDCPLGLIP